MKRHEHASQFALLRPAVKLDNRAAAARALEFWPATQNVRVKVTAGEEIPTNDAAELVVEAYAAAFGRPA
jgi:hypothetical protein